MDILAVILGLVVGTGVFFALNSMMEITYLGCGAIGSLWFGCVMFTTITFMFLGGFMMGILKWIIILGVILVVLGLIGSKAKES
ncbi:twin-arginine translocase TatA/TatE family subunit [Paraclostridium bifermentans]|uniref:twin-arginine translocase TatA/TatE family subunit n=1 Tax=Paraclostridium bifermentans TaxID=1490 RepID=UPI001C8229E3|nr:twin-arginine translocase TatA/TatE family subunit [Paraclostridium bifermentans]GIM33706.1 hypothetical protein PAGU1678_29750 [Paraclostridium bifermentans subsp. muricolitidis]